MNAFFITITWQAINNWIMNCHIFQNVFRKIKLFQTTYEFKVKLIFFFFFKQYFKCKQKKELLKYKNIVIHEFLF